ncbi:MAG: cytochrome c peroxidase [Gemmatimonadaceae bacterium]
MRNGLKVVAAIVIVVVSLAATRRGGRTAREQRAPSTAVLAVYDSGLARLDRAISELDAALATGELTPARAAFRRARSAYKEVEPFVEYYGAFAMRELNGVPMDKAEDEDPETPLPPVGLQMVEAALFPDGVAVEIRGARRYTPHMRAAIATLRRVGADTMPGDAYLFDAMRQEIARVSTLGIASFDATLSGDAIRESADALVGVREALAPYRRSEGDVSVPCAALDSAFAQTIGYLRTHPDPARIDRIEFLSRYAVPMAHRLGSVQRALRIGAPSKARAWSGRAASIYDTDAFDRSFFASTDAPAPSPGLVLLGRDLFFDPILSPSRSRSCASCHQPAKAFTDGRARAELLPGHGRRAAARNTPTLLNAALQPTLFADGRVRTLEDQATDVIGSASEMGGSLERAATALGAHQSYPSRFAAVFPAASGGKGARPLTARTIRLALAAYARSLVALDARFDRAVRGDSRAMSTEERRGFDLFMGKAGCGTCHFAPLFNGATPPTLVESEPEVIGVPSRAVARHARIDPDSGRYNIRRIDQHLHAFKTPTLRNVALTAPYMHNGVFRTLEQVLDFYDVGGGQAIGAALPHQTLPADSLHLDRAEKRAIIAFLRTLTDTVPH